jgi:hypothetical protein
LPFANNINAKSTLDTYLEEHEQAFEALKPDVSTISHDVVRNSRGDVIKFEYNYSLPGVQHFHGRYRDIYGRFATFK